MRSGARTTTLVLGGSGFLGAQLVRALLRESDAGLVATSRSGSAPAGAGVEGTRWEPLDALDERALERLLEHLRPARVLNAVALATSFACEARPGDAGALNVAFPARLGRWCRAHGARLVHVSTDLVFGARAAPAGGFREEDEPRALDRYGETKLAGERALLEAFRDALVVRLPLLFGDSFGRARGASDALLAAIARGERPRLFVDEWRTPLDVADAAAALVELARGASRGRLHVAGPRRTNRHELGLAVLQAAGRTAEQARALVEPASSASYAGPRRAEDVSLDASRARGGLASPLRDPEQALRRTGLP